MTSTEEAAAAELWRFAVALYGAPGVQESCLFLQDAEGEDVPFALFAVWAARRGGLSVAAAEAAFALATAWWARAVRPIRAVRRDLKSGAPELDGAAAAVEAFREAVKRLELEAERLALDALARLAAADRARPAGAPPAAPSEDWRAVASRIQRAGRGPASARGQHAFATILDAAELMESGRGGD